MTRFALPLPVRPLTGESGLSVASRLADRNAIALVRLLRDFAGNGDGRIGAWGDTEWRRMAVRTLLPVEALEAQRIRPAGIDTAPAAVDFLGQPVHSHSIVADRLRICPACIGERRMLKQIWQLIHCVTCADHGNQLVDRCRCGQLFSPQTRGRDPFTCKCGTPFEDNAAPAASEAALNGSQWMIQSFGAGKTATAPRLWLAKGGRVGLPFSMMPAYDILGIIDTIGRAATTPDGDDQRKTPGRPWSKGNGGTRPDIATSVAQVEAAMSVIHAWPHAYHDLLAKIAGRNGETGDATPRALFATRVGQSLLMPQRGLDGLPLAPLVHEMEAFLQSRGHAIRQKVPTRTSGTARVIRSTMPCSAVARATGVQKNSSILKRIYRETVEAFDARPNRHEDPVKLGAAVLKEIHRRLATMDEWMSPSAASEYLCHPDIATYSSMWVHADLLTPVEPDRSVMPLVKGDAFLRADVELMRKRIEAVARLAPADDIPDGHDPYGTACKVGVDATYTGTDLLLDMLSGEVPIVRTGELPRLTDLFVHTASARRRSLEKRISKIIARDQFAGTSWVEYILATLWPNRGERLTIDLNRQLRADDAVRYQTKLNTTEGRTRPLYWYSVVDHMLRALLNHGPSVSLDVDRQIAAVRDARALG